MDSTNVSSSSDGERRCPENDQFRRRLLLPAGFVVFVSSFSFSSSPFFSSLAGGPEAAAAFLCRNIEKVPDGEEGEGGGEEDEEKCSRVFVFAFFFSPSRA
jgi:hypothetical protein